MSGVSHHPFPFTPWPLFMPKWCVCCAALKLTGWTPCLHLFPLKSSSQSNFYKIRIMCDFSSSTFDGSSLPPKSSYFLSAVRNVSTFIESFLTLSLGILHPVWLRTCLLCQVVTWERRYFHMDFAAHCPPVEGFLTKREKIITEYLLLELHQTASYQREGPRLRLVDWLGTRIPGGCLSQSQRTSPGALEAPFFFFWA